jgi:chromosomal replication initiation ATPase DnaA
MNYAPTQKINTARNIARSAQRQIKDSTGMKVTLLLYPRDNTFKTPQQMLKIVAISLGMNPDCYKMKTRVRNIVELRFIAAMLLRMNFPEITLIQIASLFGGQDHSSVISGLTRGYNLIYTGDLRFMTKYNTAQKAVNVWLRKGESTYASANSA